MQTISREEKQETSRELLATKDHLPQKQQGKETNDGRNKEKGKFNDADNNIKTKQVADITPRQLQQKLSLSPRVTKLLFATILLCYMMMHIDDGILSVASESILHDLHITESQLGMIEAAMYIGIIIGSMICPYLFAKISPKFLVIGAVTFAGLGVGSWAATSNFWILASVRAVNGIFMSVQVIFYPVWIDQSAPESSQTMWISLYFLCEQVGIVLGQVVLTLSVKLLHEWKWSFLFQSIAMVGPVAILYLSIPARYYQSSAMGESGNGDMLAIESGHSLDVRPIIASYHPTGALMGVSNVRKQRVNQMSVISSAKHHVATHDVISLSILSVFNKDKHQQPKEVIEQPLTIGQIIIKLLKNPSYMLAVYAMTNLKFIVTGLQYWGPHYMKVVLGADPDLTVILVAVTVISATSVGALSGGVITTKFLGSYTNKRSVYMCLVMLILLAAACLPMSFLENPFIFIGCVWIVMFCHGFIEPIFTGILLNSVGSEEGATASSVLIFMEMILGFLPAPYIYGVLVDEIPDVNQEGDNVSHWGMRGITFYSVLGVISLIFSILFRKNVPSAEKLEKSASSENGNEPLMMGVESVVLPPDRSV